MLDMFGFSEILERFQRLFRRKLQARHVFQFVRVNADAAGDFGRHGALAHRGGHDARSQIASRDHNRDVCRFADNALKGFKRSRGQGFCRANASDKAFAEASLCQRRRYAAVNEC